MFDTMTFTKIMGGLCGTFLVFLLGKWAAEEIYHVGGGGHGEEHQAAYVIEVDEGEGGGGGGEEEEAVTLASLYSEADVGAGERVFGKCKACHQAEDGANGVGPHLYGVVGRDVDAVDGFSYSGALEEAADVWTPENLFAFLEDPKGYAPGTTMGFNGLPKPEDRANVIAFLDQTDGDMTEVAAEEGASEESASSEEGTEEEATEEASAEEGSEEQATEEASAEEGSEEQAAEEASAEEGSEEEATEEASAEEGSEEQATEEAAAEEGSEEEATEQAAAEEGSDEGGSEEQAAEESSGGDGGGSEFEQLVAAADAADGEKAFRKCAACHKAEEEANGVGPHLVGVVGRDIGSVDGFNYSDALAGLDGQWTADELNAWLEDPKGYAPGNKMAYRGVRKEEERAALVKYLESTAN
ncbi:Cytochrome c-552 [Roseovarius sp. THAF27]|uniref:c-type cytochrome n=1 Tax=Roseovarius sp. THAF27 TaxID=2587850 RepID=UPI001268A18A|nr:cytochrome c family protein [Roseovarius sp. THAF27]QFT79399.1 Cytochrome c-552 [Roseovarius sp. THAF27]